MKKVLKVLEGIFSKSRFPKGYVEFYNETSGREDLEH